MSSLLAYYDYMANLHALTGFVGKVPLLAIIFAVWGGNRNPGHRLLFAVIGAELLMASWVAFDFRGSSELGGGVGNAPLVPGLLSLAVAAVMIAFAVINKVAWDLRSAPVWRRALGWVAIAYGIYFPVFTSGLLRPIFFSPTVAIPHPLLIVLGGLMILSVHTIPRALVFISAGGLVFLGLADAVGAGIGSSWMLVALGVAVAVLPFVPAEFASRADDESKPMAAPRPRSTPRPQQPRAATPKPASTPTPAPKRERGKKQREWKLK